MATPSDLAAGSGPLPARAGDTSTDPVKTLMKTDLPLPGILQAKPPVPRSGYHESRFAMLLFAAAQASTRLSRRFVDLINGTRVRGRSGRKNPEATLCDVDQRAFELEMHKLEALHLGGLPH
jgi:hypothetical protein